MTLQGSFPAPGGVFLRHSHLSALMPMHLRLDSTGAIAGAGSTMRQMLRPQMLHFDDAFFLTRPACETTSIATLAMAGKTGQRVFLRSRDDAGLTLRGHVILLDQGELLINAGFGIGLADAVRKLALTERDFAPGDLAMELLFLHEANWAVMSELARFNRHLDEAREVAEAQAFTDPLTGLLNWRGLDLGLSAAICDDHLARTQRASSGFALMHLDLDFFKAVNDELGHAAGDAVLQAVAGVLRGATRANDAVARVGGDEFVLLLAGMTATGPLHQLAKRVIDGIEQPILVDGATCRVSASVGIARSSDYDDIDPKTIQADADAALYASKRAGRGRSTICGERINRDSANT